jgi:hypothetical protein
MFNPVRRLNLFAVVVMIIVSSTSLFGADQQLRYRVIDVADQTQPGLEWQLDPPLSSQHDAVQVLLWSGSGIIKICKGGSGRFIVSSKSFATPQPLQDAVFELSVDHSEGYTIITLAFLQNGSYQSAAELRVPGYHTLTGPTDEYLCSVKKI